MINLYEAQAANKRKSVLIVILFAAFVSVSVYAMSYAFSIYTGYELGGLGFIGISLIVSGFMTYGSYYFSDKIVLSISGARPADKKRDFTFFTVTENLAIAAGIPKPKLYVIEDTATNAFATGRDPEHAVVCATRGLLDKLTRTELEGVVAHELSHIKNYDIRLMSLVSVMVGLIALLGDWLLRTAWHGSRSRDKEGSNTLILFFGILFAILSPFIAQIIQLAISRRREFLADASGVALTRQPSGLLSALKKISADTEPLEVANKATAHLYIANPFKDRGNKAVGWFAGLFNTHPPVSERIKVLSEMS